MKIKKKILKNIIIQNFLAFIASIYIYLVKFTSKFQYENENIPKKYWDNKKPFILAFWHNQLMTISFGWQTKKQINILASGHSDGRFGAIVGKYFNLNNIPTYDENKNISLRLIFKLLEKKNYLGIAPDGPRGPKEEVSIGIIKIAKKTNIPIIPVGYWSSKNFTLNSWDSFLITLPFSKCSFVWGEPINVSKNVDDNEITNLQKLLTTNINLCIKKAKLNCL